MKEEGGQAGRKERRERERERERKKKEKMKRKKEENRRRKREKKGRKDGSGNYLRTDIFNNFQVSRM